MFLNSFDKQNLFFSLNLHIYFTQMNRLTLKRNLLCHWVSSVERIDPHRPFVDRETFVVEEVEQVDDNNYIDP